MTTSDHSDLRDPDYLAGRVLGLERDLDLERSRAERERERADLLVMACRGLADEVRELRTEVVRQGGIIARTLQVVEHLAKHLGIDPDTLAPMPDVPFHARSSRTDEAIGQLEESARATRNDPEELRRAPARPLPDEAPVSEAEPPRHHRHRHRPPPSSMPAKPGRSWRPSSAKGWAQLAGAFMLAVIALAGAARELMTSLRTPAPLPPASTGGR